MIPYSAFANTDEQNDIHVFSHMINIKEKLDIKRFWNSNLLHKDEFRPIDMLSKNDKPVIEEPTAEVEIQQDAQTIYQTALDADTIEKLNSAGLLLELKTPEADEFAKKLAEDVIKNEPTNAMAYLIHGNSVLGTEAWRSLEDFAIALKLNPYSVEGNLAVARMLEKNDLNLAYKYYYRAQELKTNN